MRLSAGGDYDGDLKDAEKKKAAGFTAFKIKVGVDTAEKDAARTRAICKILDGLLTSADANQGFNATEAMTYVRAVGGSGLGFFEQPVEAHDLAGMAAVAAATTIAIGADEGIHSLDDIQRHHDHKAARGVSLKAIKLGGIRSVVAAASCTACRKRHPERRLGPDAHPHCPRQGRHWPAGPDRTRPCRCARPSRPRRRRRRGLRASTCRADRHAQRGMIPAPVIL